MFTTPPTRGSQNQPVDDLRHQAPAEIPVAEISRLRHAFTHTLEIRVAVLAADPLALKLDHLTLRITFPAVRAHLRVAGLSRTRRHR